jgi:hypothetical protein
MARVAANTSEDLAPFFEACRIYHDFFKTPPDAGGADPARWAVFDEKPIIYRAEKLRSLEKYARFQIWHMGKLLAASQSTMELATLPSYHLCCLMEPSSRTGIFFRESVCKKNISAIRFLLV